MDKQDSLVGKVVKKYRKFSSDNPEAKFALDVAPYSGVATSLADSAADAYEGNYPDAALDLLGVVPGMKLIKGAGTVKDALKYAGTGAGLARTADQASDALTYAEEKTAEAKEPSKGDAGQGKVNPKRVNGMKNGGMTASSRGDGCCVKGKTKGRMI